MKNYIIDYIIENDEVKHEKKNILATEKKGYIIFSDNSDNYKLKIEKDNIILEKDNDVSTIKFYFKEKEWTDVYYLLKDINIKVDTKIKTVKLANLNNNIDIKYKLFIQEEEVGNFNYKLSLKEEK